MRLLIIASRYGISEGNDSSAHQPVLVAKYSLNGLLLTGCMGGMLRVYGVEPLCSLRWSCKVTGWFWSVAWSPTNRIAAVFLSGDAYAVRVWDSAFHVLLEHRQDGALDSNNGIVFASDDLLLCSGQEAHTLYLYNIHESKITTCLSHPVHAVAILSSELVCASGDDDMLRVYNVNGESTSIVGDFAA